MNYIFWLFLMPLYGMPHYKFYMGEHPILYAFKYCCACNNVICNQFYPFKVTLRLVWVGPEQPFIIGLIGPWFPK